MSHNDIGRSTFINQLSYKGVSWIYKTSSVTGGRKSAVKEFINTDRQFVEDLGKKVRSHSISGCVALLGDEDDYPTKRDTLLATLESEGNGSLIHPMYGIIENVAVISYDFSETVNSIGIGEITVEFAISNIDGEPVVEETTDASLEAENLIVLTKVELSIIEQFLADAGLLGVYDAAKAKIEDIGTLFKLGVAFVEKVESDLDEITNTIADFQNDLLVLASTPTKLASSITNVFQTINATVATASATFEIYKEFFGFGFITDIELSFDTAANNKAKTNNRTLNNTINALALSSAYIAVSGKNYRTVTELNNDLEILEEQVDRIKSAKEFDADLFASVLDARKSFLEFISNKKPTISTVIEVETTLVSARALSYQYYGDDSEAEDITEINGGFGLVYSGDIKIFSA